MRKTAADVLIEQAEEQRRLRKMHKHGAVLAANLSGKEEIELLLDQVKTDLPVLFLNLHRRRLFLEGNQDINTGHLLIVNEKLKNTEDYLNMLEKALSLLELKHINEHIINTNEFYSFEV